MARHRRSSDSIPNQGSKMAILQYNNTALHRNTGSLLRLRNPTPRRNTASRHKLRSSPPTPHHSRARGVGSTRTPNQDGT